MKGVFMNGNDELATITFSEAEVAERLGISRITAWRLRRAGKISYYLIGRSIRYGERHIAEYLASCECKKKGAKSSPEIRSQVRAKS